MVTWNYTFSWAACIPTSLPRIQNPKYLQRPFFGEFDEYLEIILASQMISHNFVLVFWVDPPRNLDSRHWKPLRLFSEYVLQVASYYFLEGFCNKISLWSRRGSTYRLTASESRLCLRRSNLLRLFLLNRNHTLRRHVWVHLHRGKRCIRNDGKRRE